MTATWRPRLRTVLFVVNLIVLALPLAGIVVLRIYESALVRQTESALIAQAAFVGAFYRNLLIAEDPEHRAALTRPAAGGVPSYRPAELDLADSPIMPPFPDGKRGGFADPLAKPIGSTLTDILTEAQRTTLAAIRVVDTAGVVVATTGEDLDFDLSQSVEVRTALQGKSISTLRRRTDQARDTPLSSVSRTTGIRVFFATPIADEERLYGAVLLSRTPPSILQALYGKRFLLAGAALVLLGVVLLMAVITSRMVTRPIARLTAAAEAVATGTAATLEVRRAPRTREIATLQASVAEMADALERRARYLQEFSRHVSHEFKSPITSIRGAVEVLQEHMGDMSDDQRARFLANIGTDADRLRRLTERLNELTRAEITPRTIERVDLNALVTEYVQNRPTATPTITVTTAATPRVVRADREILRAAVDTLVENAQQHGATEVQLAVDERVSMVVADNGTGISEHDRTKIFEPFFTTNRENGGTGLGLTIARTLLKQMDATLQLLHVPPASGMSTAFEIAFQPADTPG